MGLFGRVQIFHNPLMGIGVDEGGAYEGMVGMRDSWNARVCLMTLMLQICFTDYWMLIQKIIDNIQYQG